MALFDDKAPQIMRRLMADFGLDDLSAAAILGNLGHESGGFKFLQEKKPLVPGSKGGYGWAQWTGPRRRQFEAYVKAQNLNGASDAANYGFLLKELEGSEKAAIPAVKKAVCLDAKVRAFEKAFERAGVKHYDSRLKWAQRALKAFGAPSAITAAPMNTIENEYRKSEVVKKVQARLKELGYHGVGIVDGKWGKRTEAAILAFRNDNKMPLKPEIDKELVDKITMPASLVQRTVSPERANVTSEQLEKVNPVMANLGTAKNILKFFLPASAALGAGQVTTEAISDTTDRLSAWQQLWDIAQTVWPVLLILGLGGVVWYFIHQARTEQKQSFKEGAVL